MKEQYRQEMQRIHVPESLIEKTKLAMKEEEQRIKEERGQKKVVPFGKISVAAAAAILLLLLIPAATTEGTFGGTESTSQGQIYLAGKEEAEIVKIEAEETETGFGAWLKEVIDKIGELFE
ncbi:MAG: hypothetical protein IJ409_07600 [Lachnospiraceae bacterium]|nr:hypothetical protein [Lachnospiraceae bacterium]